MFVMSPVRIKSGILVTCCMQWLCPRCCNVVSLGKKYVFATVYFDQL